MSESGAIHVITDERCTAYSAPGPPERPERILRTVERLRGQDELRLEWLHPQTVDEEVLLRAHSPAHLKRLEKEVDFEYVVVAINACIAANVDEVNFAPPIPDDIRGRMGNVMGTNR